MTSQDADETTPEALWQEAMDALDSGDANAATLRQILALHWPAYGPMSGTHWCPACQSRGVKDWPCDSARIVLDAVLRPSGSPE